MARSKPPELRQWMQTLGEQIGSELGQIIADSLARTLESRVDLQALSARLQGGRKSGRGKAQAACEEAGCDKPVLAKGLCRSHYYRARYRSRKSSPPRRARKGASTESTAG